MKYCWKLMAWLMVLGLMAVGIYRPVLADSNETPIETETSSEDPVTSKSDCSITMTIDPTGTATGGSFLAYRVAEIVSDDGYAFKSLYGDTEADFSDATKKTKLITVYKEYIDNNGIEATCKTTADKGVISFTGLKTGLYLIVQETAVTDYTNLDTTLVSVPYQNSDGTFKFNVVAISKPTITTTEATTEATTESTEGTEYDDDTDDSETEESEESDSSSSSTESKKLPQTGQLWWPLPLLLCGGLLLMFVGRRIRK